MLHLGSLLAPARCSHPHPRPPTPARTYQACHHRYTATVAQVLDCSSPPQQWPLPPGTQLAAVLAINLTHISPWAATAGLLRGAGTWLAPGGLVIIYGPFKVRRICCRQTWAPPPHPSLLPAPSAGRNACAAMQVGGHHTSEGNATFDASLRQQNPSWSVVPRHCKRIALGLLPARPRFLAV